MENYVDPSGFLYNEHYLYSNKAWEMAPSGVSSFNLAHGPQQNAPIVVTASGLETTDANMPWAQVNGLGKYLKLGYGYFDLINGNQYNPNARQFSLHPDASGKLVFNGTLKENVYIEYEASASGYYIMDSVDYNPIRNEVQGGFVHFSQVTDPTNLYLTASQSSLRADGFQHCKLTATVYDSDFDRVPDVNIIFEIQGLRDLGGGAWSELGYLLPNGGSILTTDASGYSISVLETTTRRGEAQCQYWTHNGKTGIQNFKAYYVVASGVYDNASLAQYYFSVSPFILDLSLLDTLDYLS